MDRTLEPWQLKQRQGLDLEVKIRLTEERLKAWYRYWNGAIYISFSGGKDSTVLLDIARKLYPKVTAVFVDTGLEFPEIRSFIKEIDNVVWLKPKMSFTEVLKKYGYPVISKENAQKIYEIRNSNSEFLVEKRLFGDDKGNGRLPFKWHYMIDAPFKISSKCCNVMKKSPFSKYEKDSKLKPVVATMAQDSSMRKMTYLKNGCNSFESTRPMSTPMSFWLEKDVWDYIHKNNTPYSEIYDKGYTRTGCTFCMFGIHLKEDKVENRFQRMKKTHPNMYNYCISKLEIGKVLDFMNIEY